MPSNWLFASRRSSSTALESAGQTRNRNIVPDLAITERLIASAQRAHDAAPGAPRLIGNSTGKKKGGTMRFLLSACGWIVLCAVLGSATATAAQPAEEAVMLPNATEPKPDMASSQGSTQMVIMSLERRSESASNSQTKDQSAVAPPDKRSLRALPVHRPKPN
jgi:hypothetical protein